MSTLTEIRIRIRVLIKNYVSSMSASLSSAECTASSGGSPIIFNNNKNCGTKDRLHPYFVTGFSDAESAFVVSIRRGTQMKTG
jgi:hypothetical protein